MAYEIVDRHTGAVVGRVKTLKGAARAVDQRDNAYGGYRFGYRLAAVAPPSLNIVVDNLSASFAPK